MIYGVILITLTSLGIIWFFAKKGKERKTEPPKDYFEGFIGNEGVVNFLKKEVRYAQLTGTKKIPNIALFGPKSSGKTELSRRLAKAIGLSVLNISQSLLGSEKDFLTTLYNKSYQIPSGNRKILPYLIFIDEVHTLNRKLQDLLLTGLEADDRVIRSKLCDFDCSDVVFVVATTDPGKLVEAFRSRFVTLQLEPYTSTEIVQILKLRMQSDKTIERSVLQLDDDSLELIARVARLVPRQAISILKNVGKSLRLGDTVPNIESVFAELNETYGCDYLGLNALDRKYLTQLAKNGTLGQNALVAALGVDKDTLSNVIEPYLMQTGLVMQTPRGRHLTELGKELCQKYNNNQELYN